ncbi:MAG: hypothetical protein KDB10_21215 [Acidimicrobiales bacterium]|nr:hypothetical protein [Acidimicrobiales bacterium]MCB9373073.1 hypothetical protein [Microthrixaceae bacterium]
MSGATRSGARSTRHLPAGDRAALAEERDFLLGSLDDLDRELEAGDISEDDYHALKDDYTVRAAAVVRALEDHDASALAADADRVGDGGQGSNRARTVVVSGLVVVFAVLAGLAIANNYGTRAPGESLVDDGVTSDREKVSQAQQLEASGDPDALAEAAALYDEVLERDPRNVDALTYKGWLLVRAGIAEGMDLLDQAIEIRPGFAPPHVFKAVALRNQGSPEAALAELDAVDPTQLSAFAGLVANLRQELEAQVAAGDTSDGAGAATTPTTSGGGATGP